jgi:hypothetical protein
VRLSALAREALPDVTDFGAFMATIDHDPPLALPEPVREPSPDIGDLEEPPFAQVSQTSRSTTPTCSPPPSTIPEELRRDLTFCTTPNAFGLYRVYREKPSFVPDPLVEYQAAIKPGTAYDRDEDRTHAPDTIEAAIAPYPNLSCWLFDYENYVSGNGRSQNETDSLQTVITRDDFHKEELRGVNLRNIRKKVYARSGIAPWLAASEEWTQKSLSVMVPTLDKETAAQRKAALLAMNRYRAQQKAGNVADDDTDSGVPEEGSQDEQPGVRLRVPGFHHQSIVGAVRAFWETHPLSNLVHMHGFSLRQACPPTAALDPSREPPPPPTAEPDADAPVHGEIYNSERFLRYEEELHLARSNGTHPMAALCSLPWIICALMFWSDATQLAQFGSAKAWPIYMYIGNLSKYFRLRPSAKAAIVLAFIPSVR